MRSAGLCRGRGASGRGGTCERQESRLDHRQAEERERERERERNMLIDRQHATLAEALATCTLQEKQIQKKGI